VTVTLLPAIVRRRSTPRVVAIGLYIAAFAAVGAVLPYIPVYFQSLGLPLDAIGLVAAVAALCGLVAAPAWGVIADQAVGARGALFSAAVLAVLAAIGVAIAPAAVIAVLAWIVYQLSFAGVSPVLDAFALDQVGADQHRYARFRVWGSASFVVSVISVGYLIQQAGLSSIFVALLGCLAACVILALLVPAKTTARASRSLSGLRSVLGSRPLMVFIGAVLVVWSASSMVNGFYSIYLTSLGTPAGLIGSAWALGAVVEVPVMLAFPVLAVRFGVGRLIIFGATCLLLRALVVVFATDPLIVVATMALHGLGYALLLVGGVTYVASRAPAGSAATAQGVLAGVVFGLSSAIGPGVAGVIAGATSIHTMFAFAAATSAVGVLAVALAVGWFARRAVPAAT
jgi:PPP family 3-phenylpropionic acid transporter